jgi:PAS domain S-box-containing protein
MRKRKKRAARPAVHAEERKHWSFFEHAAEGFFRCTPTGRFIEMNPALVRLLGYESVEEVLALTLPEDLYLHAAQYADLGAHFAAAERIKGKELRWKKKDGGSVFVSLHAWAVHDARQRVIAYEGIVMDITARKQAEEARQTEVALAASLAQEGEELMTRLDTPTLLSRLCQLAAEEVRCHTSHAFLWQPQEEAYLPIASWGDTPEQWQIIRTCKVPGTRLTGLMPQPMTEEITSVTTTTIYNLFPVEVWPVGVTTHLWLALRRGEKLVGALSLEYRGCAASFSVHQERLARGVGALAALVLANVQLLQELMHANRFKSDFLATISHELRTPLHIVLGYADCLLEGDFGGLTVKQRKALHAIDHSARELLELIVALLEASQLATVKPPVEQREVNIVELIADVQQDTTERSKRSGLSVIWRVSPTLPSLYTDRIKLKIILKNLLSNAIKFAPEGTITVEVFPHEEGVAFRVSDTGVGIAPEVLPVIFELFRQGDSSATRRYGGTGLGLYIVRQMLEVLGGTVAVDSERGRGSTFRVWLPINRTAAAGMRNSVGDA